MKKRKTSLLTWIRRHMCVCPLSCVYTLRLIGPISYPGECDLMVHSRMHFVTFVYIYNMHQDTKSARLIAVCKRTFNKSRSTTNENAHRSHVIV